LFGAVVAALGLGVARWHREGEVRAEAPASASAGEVPHAGLSQSARGATDSMARGSTAQQLAGRMKPLIDFMTHQALREIESNASKQMGEEGQRVLDALSAEWDLDPDTHAEVAELLNRKAELEQRCFDRAVARVRGFDAGTHEVELEEFTEQAGLELRLREVLGEDRYAAYEAFLRRESDEAAARQARAEAERLTKRLELSGAQEERVAKVLSDAYQDRERIRAEYRRRGDSSMANAKRAVALEGLRDVLDAKQLREYEKYLKELE
jgi:hypothetical protein